MEEVKRWYRIGGFVISLQMPPIEEGQFLSPFRCAETEADWSFTVRVGRPTLPTQTVYLRRELHSGSYLDGECLCRVLFRERSEQPLLISRRVAPSRFDVCIEEECLSLWDGNLLMKLLDLPTLLLQKGAVFLHASFVAYGGRAVLFTAPKQTGKSTQAELWQRYLGAEVINGDRVLLRRKDQSWYAFGSPYCGTSQICRAGEYPVAALVVLRQGKENALRMARPREVAAALLDGCTFDPLVQTEQILDAALELQECLPVYHFSCLPQESAVYCLRDALFL